jgi:hypothetical protein
MTRSRAAQRYLKMTCPAISFVDYETHRRSVSEFKASFAFHQPGSK